MAEIDDILKEVALESVPVFKNEYEGTGYINTGQSLQGIQAVDNTIAAPVSIHTLVFGRKPGEYPPWGYVQGSTTPTSLMQWCMDVFGETDKQAKSSSFLVARKLKDEGNRVYKGTAPPIPIDTTIEKANEAMFSKVLDNFNETIKAYELQ